TGAPLARRLLRRINRDHGSRGRPTVAALGRARGRARDVAGQGLHANTLRAAYSALQGIDNIARPPTPGRCRRAPSMLRAVRAVVKGSMWTHPCGFVPPPTSPPNTT